MCQASGGEDEVLNKVYVTGEDPSTSVEAKTRFTPPYSAVGPIINPKFHLLVNRMLP